MPKPAAAVPATAEQKIDAVIQRAHTARVVVDLLKHDILPAEITPDLLGRYHAAGWRTAVLDGDILTLSN